MPFCAMLFTNDKARTKLQSFYPKFGSADEK